MVYVYNSSFIFPFSKQISFFIYNLGCDWGGLGPGGGGGGGGLLGLGPLLRF